MHKLATVWTIEMSEDATGNVAQSIQTHQQLGRVQLMHSPLSHVFPQTVPGITSGKELVEWYRGLVAG